MKVAMENVILIVCPQGFAPLTSKRHTYAGCDDMFLFVLVLFFSSTTALPQILFFGGLWVGGGAQLFVESLFDEVITSVD